MTSPPTSEATVQELFNLDGQTAIVTGGTGYLGRAMAAALAEAGATVAVTSTSQERAEQMAAELPAGQLQRHIGGRLDQLDEESLEEQFDQLVERAGGQVDILVNNGHEFLTADWKSVTGAEFNRQLANATGYFMLARRMRKRAVEAARPASIIMLGSMYGVVGSYPEVYEGVCPVSPAAYHALKGGIVQLTRHLAVAWAPDSVRVNCLSPGAFPQTSVPEALVERLSQRVPLKRMGLPQELKGAVLFLASEASSYLTGHNLIVDGGWTAW